MVRSPTSGGAGRWGPCLWRCHRKRFPGDGGCLGASLSCSASPGRYPQYRCTYSTSLPPNAPGHLQPTHGLHLEAIRHTVFQDFFTEQWQVRIIYPMLWWCEITPKQIIHKCHIELFLIISKSSIYSSKGLSFWLLLHLCSFHQHWTSLSSFSVVKLSRVHSWEEATLTEPLKSHYCH